MTQPPAQVRNLTTPKTLTSDRLDNALSENRELRNSLYMITFRLSRAHFEPVLAQRISDLPYEVFRIGTAAPASSRSTQLPSDAEYSYNQSQRLCYRFGQYHVSFVL